MPRVLRDPPQLGRYHGRTFVQVICGFCVVLAGVQARRVAVAGAQANEDAPVTAVAWAAALGVGNDTPSPGKPDHTAAYVGSSIGGGIAVTGLVWLAYRALQRRQGKGVPSSRPCTSDFGLGIENMDDSVTRDLTIEECQLDPYNEGLHEGLLHERDYLATQSEDGSDGDGDVIDGLMRKMSAPINVKPVHANSDSISEGGNADCQDAGAASGAASDLAGNGDTVDSASSWALAFDALATEDEQRAELAPAASSVFGGACGNNTGAGASASASDTPTPGEGRQDWGRAIQLSVGKYLDEHPREIPEGAGSPEQRQLLLEEHSEHVHAPVHVAPAEARGRRGGR
jgi:hypothetical protein